jgi:hypothetical protein
MTHEPWIQARIDQVEELLDAGCELSQIVEILNNDGFMRIFNGKNVTEDFVFNACLVILAKRMEAKRQIEEEPDVSDEGFDPYSNCYTDDC